MNEIDETKIKIEELRVEMQDAKDTLDAVRKKLEVQNLKLIGIKSEAALKLIKTAYVRTGTSGFYAVVDKTDVEEYKLYRKGTCRPLDDKSKFNSFFAPNDCIPTMLETELISDGSEKVPAGLTYDEETEAVIYDVLLEMQSVRLGWSADESNKIAIDRDPTVLNVPTNVKILKSYGVNVSLDLITLQAEDMASQILSMRQMEDDLRSLVKDGEK